MSLDTALPGTVVAEATTAPIGREQLARYAAASGDLNPLHLDPAFAKKAGFDDVIVHGMLGMALVGELCRRQFPDWTLRRYDARFTGVLAVDQRLRCTAILGRRDADGVQLALEAFDDGGRSIIVGSAVLARPA